MAETGLSLEQHLSLSISRVKRNVLRLEDTDAGRTGEHRQGKHCCTNTSLGLAYRSCLVTASIRLEGGQRSLRLRW